MKFAPALTLILIALLTASCSAEAKKNRAMKRAEEYFKAGDYERAKIEYMNWARLDQQNPEPYAKIGQMWLEDGAALRAGPFLAKAKELAPARAEVRVKLGELFLSVGALTEARQEALEALKLQPANGEALLVLADVARTPQDFTVVEQQLQKQEAHESATYHLAVATLALRKQDLGAVEAALVRATALDPKMAAAHAALGRLRYQQGNQKAAADEFKLAADVAAPRAPAQLFFAEYKMQIGARDEALAHLNSIAKKAPDYLPAWILLAKITAQKNVDEALPLLENVFRRDPQNFDGRILQSDLLIVKGDGKGAVEKLKALEAVFPKVPVVKYQLGRALLQAGDPLQTITSLEQAIALAPQYPEAVLLLAEVNLRMSKPEPVIAAMEDFLKANPTNGRAQVLLADAYRATGRYDDAVALLQKLVAASPDKAETYVLLGVVLRQQNKVPEARAALEKAVELSPDNYNALNQLTEIDVTASDFAGAMKRIDAQLEKRPDSAGLHLLKGKIYVAQRDWPHAEDALQKVMQLNAELPAAYELLVATYLGANKLPQAASQLEGFLARLPNNTGALMTLALVATELKDYQKARDAYEKLLAVRPDNVVAMNNLANVYANHLGQLDKALELASKARTAEPGSASIADTFAWILYKRGDYKQAASILKESAEKSPNNSEIHYHAGMASYMMGDMPAAKAELEAALRTGNESVPWAEETKRRLLILGGSEAGGQQLSVADLEALVKEQPNDPLALTKLGDLYAQQGAPDKAANTYEQALKINPNLPSTTLKLAELYAGPLHNTERAFEFAKKARDLTSEDPRAAATLGRIAFEIGNFQWAYSVLQESVRRLGDDGANLRSFAWAAYSLGKVGEAREAMERVTKASPPDSAEARDATTFLALTAQESGVPDAAREAEAQRALQQDASYVPALLVLGRNQASRGEKDAAINTFNQVLRRFPDFAPAQKELAALYLQDMRDPQKAYEMAANARKSMPGDPELAAIFGQASYHKKDYSRAAQLLQESNRKQPLNGEGLFYLGMALVETKQTVQGRELLERAVQTDLPEPLASEAAKVLRPLRKKGPVAPARSPHG